MDAGIVKNNSYTYLRISYLKYKYIPLMNAIMPEKNKTINHLPIPKGDV